RHPGRPGAARLPARYARLGPGRAAALPAGAGTAGRARPARPGPRPGAHAGTQALRGRPGRRPRRRPGGAPGMAGAALGSGGTARAAVRPGTGHPPPGLRQAAGAAAGCAYLMRLTLTRVL